MYEVTVVVTDTKGNSDEQDVTVKVTNMEETGTVTLSTLQPRVGFPVTATLADAGQHNCGQRLLAVVPGSGCDAGATWAIWMTNECADGYYQQLTASSRAQRLTPTHRLRMMLAVSWLL